MTAKSTERREVVELKTSQSNSIVDESVVKLEGILVSRFNDIR